MLNKIFGADGIKSFFSVRDEDGNFDWEEVLATTIQTILILGTVLFFYLIGLI